MRTPGAWAGAVVGLLAGCVGPVDFDDAPCPCALGFVCTNGRCRPALDASNGKPDALASDALPPAPDARAPDARADASEPDAGAVDASTPRACDDPRCPNGAGCLDDVCVEWTQVASYFASRCATMAGGEVACWGGCALPSSPTVVPGLTDAVRTYMGGWQSCAIREEGRVSCWIGPEFCGRGLGEAAEVAFDGPVVDLALMNAPGFAGCGLLDDGRLQCWGDNSSGIYGREGPSSSTPITIETVPPVTKIRAIHGALRKMCIVHGETGSKLTCWSEGSSPVGPVDFGSIRDVEIDTGYFVVVLSETGIHFGSVLDVPQFSRVADSLGVERIAGPCRFDAGGSLQCNYIVLGTGYHPADLLGSVPDDPGDLTVTTDVRDFAAENFAVHVVDSAGRLLGFGSNEVGRVGTGVEPQPSGRFTVPLVPPRSTPRLGRQSGCAITPEGELVCWGYNNNVRGNLGRTGGQGPPRLVDLGDRTVLDARLFGNDVAFRSTALLVEESGANRVYVSGVFVPPGMAPRPDLFPEFRRITELDGAQTLDAVRDEICALLQNGTFRCVNEQGYVDVPEFASATDADLEWGGLYRLAIVDGRVICSPGVAACPDDLAQIQGAERVWGGSNFGMVLRDDGRIVTFGGHPIFGATPPRVTAGLTQVVGAETYRDHACFWKADGTTDCWGGNVQGQIDPDNPNSPIFAPYRLSGRYREVDVGEFFTCGTRISDDRIECWGDNERCNLGECPGLVYEDLVFLPSPVR